MSSKNDTPIIITGVWGKKFIIFSIFLIAIAAVAVIFFDKSEKKPFNLLNPSGVVDTTKSEPIKPINPGKTEEE